jgi:hypothetical protein
MDYRSEFPDFDRILDIDLIAAHGLADSSWHNDSVPSFAKIVGDHRIVLWANYADPALREVPDTHDFVVSVEEERGSGDEIAYHSAATLADALAIVDTLTI